MADVGQLLLQNELFVALGATLFAALPAISLYWLPAINPNSAPEQFQLSSGAAIATTVTRTATIFPKPKTLTDKVYQTIVQTQTATQTATTTATVPKTIYDTITEKVTSVSTSIDRYYITKWTHLSVDNPTPCTTVVYTPDVTMQSLGRPASRIQLRKIATPPTTTPKTSSWVPWKPFAYALPILLAISFVANMIMWTWRSTVVMLQGEVQALQETVEIGTRSRQQMTEIYENNQAILTERCGKAEKVATMVRAKGIMLRKLGVPIPSDEVDTQDFDREMLADMVQARMNVLADEKQRLDRIEMENRDQIAEINRLKETIATQLYKDYIPGVSHSFDSLLHDKQKEIDNLRKAIRGGNFSEANEMLHQEKDAELSKLRPLREEVETLKQALIEAKKETARVEEENRVKGVAEQRRLNEARFNARKERSDEISDLRERQVARVADLGSRREERDEELNTLKNKIAGLNLQLRKAERALVSSHKTQQPQSSDRPTIDEPRQCFNDPSSKQNTSTETEDYLRRSLDEKDQEYRELQQNFVVLAQQHREKVEELEKLKEHKDLQLEDLKEYKDLQQNFLILAKEHREKVGELEELKDRLANDKERCEEKRGASEEGVRSQRYEGLERNQALKEGEATYAEARAGLFMGSDSNISDAMEKCAKFTEDLEAEVGRLREEVEKLRKYDEKVVEEEMDMEEKTTE